METKSLYFFPSSGELVGVSVVSKDAFDAHMLRLYNGQSAELIPSPLVPYLF